MNTTKELQLGAPVAMEQQIWKRVLNFLKRLVALFKALFQASHALFKCFGLLFNVSSIRRLLESLLNIVFDFAKT